MKALARFVMQGYPQAALVAASAALLSLILPLVGLFSSAAVALYTLRSGVREGALLTGLATLGCALLSLPVVGTAWPALGVLAVLWLPAWALAALLRISRSLSLTVTAAGLIGAVLVGLFHALVADPAAYWTTLLEPLREGLARDGIADEAGSRVLFAELARWMTGSFAAALVLQWLLGLFLARWWQALLYHPGGFGAEFRGLKLHLGVGIAGLVLLALVAFVKGPGLVPDLLVVLSPLWLLQGLSLIHWLHRARGAHVGWLVGLYAALVLLLPHAEILVACLGLVDIWADVRRRLGSGPGPGPARPD